MLVVIKIKHVGLCSLNKILPEKLCLKANLPRKTVHCLCITCATRLFQHNVGDKLAREQTGHKSNALFSYQKPNGKELDDVSNVLGAVIASTETVLLEYPWRGYDGSFEWFTCGKADSETVAWEGLWMATDLISVIFRTEPFYSRFPYVFRLLDFFFDTELLKYFQFRMFVIAYFRVLLFRPILAECIW